MQGSVGVKGRVVGVQRRWGCTDRQGPCWKERGTWGCGMRGSAIRTAVVGVRGGTGRVTLHVVRQVVRATGRVRGRSGHLSTSLSVRVVGEPYHHPTLFATPLLMDGVDTEILFTCAETPFAGAVEVTSGFSALTVCTGTGDTNDPTSSRAVLDVSACKDGGLLLRKGGSGVRGKHATEIHRAREE